MTNWNTPTSQSVTSRLLFRTIGRLLRYSHRHKHIITHRLGHVQPPFHRQPSSSATHPADQTPLSHLADLHFTDYGHVPKNGVNTCPLISEYEIINAPKFSAVIMPLSAISAPNLVTDSLNLSNSDLILPQIPRNPHLPKQTFPF